jgi:catechol 2,3-dioxygenase-like lactoylglutathione lyase family enzyme
MEHAMTLNHIDLPVSDIAGARAFFGTFFGFRCIFERADGLSVLLDEANFALTLSAVPAGETLRYPTGFHVGFNLQTEDELMRLHELLRSSGIEIALPLGDLGGALSFQCHVPGPLKVELSWRPRG